MVSRICGNTSFLRLTDKFTCMYHRKLIARSLVTGTSVSFASEKPGATKDDSKSPKAASDLDDQVSIPDVILKEIPEATYHWEYQQSPDSALVYDRKPIKIKCTEGRMYMWCACGHSHRQPFCDGTHRLSHWKIKLKPVPWTCRKTGNYWFCNCKKASKKPFCDGSHLEIPDSEPTTIKY